MSLASMTGFARGEGQCDGVAWTWEAKSVNARGLDVRCRLPAGLEALEPLARQRVAAAVKRGNVSITLQLGLDGGAAGGADQRGGPRPAAGAGGEASRAACRIADPAVPTGCWRCVESSTCSIRCRPARPGRHWRRPCSTVSMRPWPRWSPSAVPKASGWRRFSAIICDGWRTLSEQARATRFGTAAGDSRPAAAAACAVLAEVPALLGRAARAGGGAARRQSRSARGTGPAARPPPGGRRAAARKGSGRPAA